MEEAFRQDQREALDPESPQMFSQSYVRNPMRRMQADKPMEKLPAPLSLMNYQEVGQVLSREILLDYWENGGVKKMITKFGAKEFQPSFWDNKTWPWTSVDRAFSKMSSDCFPGEGGLLPFLKEQLRRRMVNKGINDQERYVTPSWVFGGKTEKRRRAKRGMFVNSSVK